MFSGRGLGTLVPVVVGRPRHGRRDVAAVAPRRADRKRHHLTAGPPTPPTTPGVAHGSGAEVLSGLRSDSRLGGLGCADLSAGESTVRRAMLAVALSPFGHAVVRGEACASAGERFASTVEQTVQVCGCGVTLFERVDGALGRLDAVQARRRYLVPAIPRIAGEVANARIHQPRPPPAHPGHLPAPGRHRWPDRARNQTAVDGGKGLSVGGYPCRISGGRGRHGRHRRRGRDRRAPGRAPGTPVLGQRATAGAGGLGPGRPGGPQ